MNQHIEESDDSSMGAHVKLFSFVTCASLPSLQLYCPREMSHQRRYAMLWFCSMHDQKSGSALLVGAGASQEKVLQCLSKKTR
jgi:hypothetical protein